MTVTGAQVVIREIHLNGGAYTYRGSVSGVGEVSAVYQSKALPTDVGPSAFTVFGTIMRRHSQVSGGMASANLPAFTTSN
jgi:hypothetical protein